MAQHGVDIPKYIHFIVAYPGHMVIYCPIQIFTLTDIFYSLISELLRKNMFKTFYYDYGFVYFSF